MKHLLIKLDKNKFKILGTLLALTGISALVYLAYQINLIQDRNILFSLELQNLNTKQLATEKRLSDTVAVLEENLSLTKTEQNKLKNALDTEQAKVKDQAQQLASITGTVGTLEKLTYTDKELLKKYSKVYFLNENYIPINLSKIDNLYVDASKKDLQIHSSVLPYLQKMMDASNNDGQSLRVRSAYRSFDSQATIKSSYDVIYGAGTANQFSAEQGYSEHQLGTTMDFTTKQMGSNFDDFAFTKGYQWLLSSAYKYGFVLSYPPDNKFYKFEPWHWRFVGVKLATDLKNQNKY
ncbi:MAG: M15 family metallopeptidase, partial [bacterium]|nr:M15 family metallopeptidase [bacterium]